MHSVDQATLLLKLDAFIVSTLLHVLLYEVLHTTIVLFDRCTDWTHVGAKQVIVNVARMLFSRKGILVETHITRISCLLMSSLSCCGHWILTPCCLSPSHACGNGFGPSSAISIMRCIPRRVG